MKIAFTVNGLPPKKDGANSMWRKGTELSRLKALRLAAINAVKGEQTAVRKVQIALHLHAPASAGDLDNFITGICDGLMAAHRNLIPYISEDSWSDVPDEISPWRPIVFEDDACVERIVAERLQPETGEAFYELEIEIS